MSQASSKSVPFQRVAQIALLAIVAWVSWTLVEPVASPKAEVHPEGSTFDMLGFLDSKVGLHEDDHDVRCWSSVNKLQMFITDFEIDEKAQAERVDQHVLLIESIYKATALLTPVTRAITGATMETFLRHRFAMKDEIEGVSLTLPDSPSTLIEGEALQDYSDTIESWRLIQTWASRHQHRNTQGSHAHHFTKAALEKLQIFIQAYDLAILRRARKAALARKQSHIDREAILAGFKARKDTR